VLDIYTKSGGLGEYAGYIVLDPDHEIGFSVLAAGAEASNQAAVLAWIPAFEATTRDQAQLNYAGTYTAVDKRLNSSITVALDEPSGLGIESWISNGTD
jgi:hypothetical protein